MSNQEMNVYLYDFAADGSCSADIFLPATGNMVRGIKVMEGTGGGTQVYMPEWMNNRWSCPDLSWADARKAVAAEYKADRQKPQGICTFRNVVNGKEIPLEFDLPSGVTVHEISLLLSEDNRFFLNLHKSSLEDTGYTKEILLEELAKAYRNQILHETEEISTLTVRFQKEIRYQRCLADLKLPEKKNVIKGFRIWAYEDGTLNISSPSWMERWSDRHYTWYQITEIIKAEYRRFAVPEQNEIPQKPETEPEQPAIPKKEERTEKTDPEKTELGRIKNARNNSLAFYPHTVLRLVENRKEMKQQASQLAYALSIGSQGGLGPFEITVLTWVNRLKYDTSTLLVDLMEAGYLDYGWREKVSQQKLPGILDRMKRYDLINLTRFVTVNDDGEPVIDNSHSLMRIISMGKNGASLLHELLRDVHRYNPFDILQDGNTVRRYLSVNQWLVYMLCTYKEEIGEKYVTTCVVQQKGAVYTAARVYGMVTLKQRTLVAESVRRTEAFEAESYRQFVIQKLERLSVMFENPDQLYCGRDPFSLPHHPAIVIICEDDDHMREIAGLTIPLAKKHQSQEFLYTTDLRIFNYEYQENRFLEYEGGEFRPVQVEA